MERLSSGLRVNHASDDPAGIAIAERMEARGRAIRTGIRGVNDLISLVQVADASLASIGQNLQRIRELAVQAANSTNTTADRQALDLESRALMTASRLLQNSTTFNGQQILNGSLNLNGVMPGLDASLSLYIQNVFQEKTTDELFRYAQMAQAACTISPNGPLASGDLRINGVAVAASVAGSQAGQTSDSAWSVAQAIAGVGITGLSAVANATSITGSSTLPPGGGVITSGQITINGVSVGAGNYVSAINAVSGQTGVTASVVAGAAPLGFPANIPYTLTLRAADGRNINVSGAGGFGLSDQNSVASLTVTGPLAEGASANLVLTGGNPAIAGFSGGTVAAVDSGAPVYVPLDEDAGFDQNPNLQTADAASSTIILMDRKLDKLLALRPKLGAAQNVLELRSAFLANAEETNAAAKSRIVDADYAVEMSTFVSSKIIQASGLAMIAQSNVDPGRLVAMLLGAN
jgi:flagellin